MPHPTRKRLVRWLRRSRIGARLVAPFALLGPNGYAGSIGWLRSTTEQEAIDLEGEPIPWMSYPLIHFLEGRLQPHMRVFEYGSGHSTLWLGARVAEVVACDHTPAWAARIRRRAPGNVRVLDVEEDEAYPSAALEIGDTFDIVVIDGRHRVECAHTVAGGEILGDHGVIVWDDTERERYLPGIEGLLGRGFRQLPFHGLGPILAYGFETSIFYRPDNCLGI